MFKNKLKALTCAAMMTAISVIIGIFCKNFMNFGAGLFRITFENMPIILSGIVFGPVIGGIVGAVTDLVSYLLSAQIYPPNLIVTLGATLIGAVSGLVSNYIVKKDGNVKIILSGVFAHLVGSIVVKSIGLYQFYGVLVLWRIPLYAVIMTIEIFLICLLYRNANFRKLFCDFKS